MKTKIIRIGNSKGVRIPKSLLDGSGLKDDVELIPAEEGLLLRPVHAPRFGWDAAFSDVTRSDLAEFLEVPTTLSAWDETEWTW
ncbi:AbrB/MazE/SpoVT family DNA-binding domain-containing protein [bacterium]|nr:AbrB/MazE/SpoVT family DNA-binding domain-containing protein [bacterium]